MGTTSVAAEKPLTEAQWLIRFVFLESIAGVPGMVGGMLRHLNSLRRMKRDNGWIETLLEESYNERMHLLTFLKICDRFVGYLEEEAVHTYTRCIGEIEQGLLPKW